MRGLVACSHGGVTQSVKVFIKRHLGAFFGSTAGSMPLNDYKQGSTGYYYKRKVMIP
jgi:hypothetical protein